MSKTIWILFAVLAVVIGVGMFNQEPSPPAEETPAASPPVSPTCQPSPEAGQSIQEGLTVDGGFLQNAQAVEFSPPVGNVRYAVAAEIEGPGFEGPGQLGAWGIGSLDGSGPLWALDATAIEFSEWLAAAAPGSPADQLRDEAASRPEVAAAKACVAE